MTENDFKEQLASHGMSVVIPEPGSSTPWGLIDLGNGSKINRWVGGSTFAEHLAYAIQMKKKQSPAQKKATAKAGPKLKVVADDPEKRSGFIKKGGKK